MRNHSMSKKGIKDDLFDDQRASKDDEGHRCGTQANAQEDHSDPPPNRIAPRVGALGQHPGNPPRLAIPQLHVIPIHIPRPQLRIQNNDVLNILSPVGHRAAELDQPIIRIPQGTSRGTRIAPKERGGNRSRRMMPRKKPEVGGGEA
ncbi:hypothetical protein B296_00000915 [Ensete ventricosum]|uniref:Uncharacterized protein n=1 Tax=Ensete ventricosum TaxID=4639 RepID=A0A427BAT3_ENSVE|nr:hypothetical protein B296_00000915 [Ensete ventricosum]